MPDIRGITRSVRMMCAGCSSNSANAPSPLFASLQIKPSPSATVMQSRRILSSSSTTRKRIPKRSLTCFPHGLLNNRNELLHSEWLLHTRYAGTLQYCCSFLAGHVARYIHQSRRQFRTIRSNPGVHVGAINTPRSTHIRNHAQKFSCLQLTQPSQIRYTQLRSRYAPARRTRSLRRRAHLQLAKWAKALPGEQVSSWFSEPRDCRNRRQLSHSR